MEGDCVEEEGTENALAAFGRLGADVVLRCGVEAMDRAIGGGFKPARLYEFIGDVGSGKTQVII